MMKFLQAAIFTFLLFGLPMVPLANALPQDDTPEWRPQDTVVALTNYQQQLNAIKQQVSSADNDAKLNKLYVATQALSTATDKLSVSLQPFREKLQAQLNVLGSPPEGNNFVEASSVIQQRKRLDGKKKQLDDAINRIHAIRDEANYLGQKINGLRRVTFKTQLALNTGSVFSSEFWLTQTSAQIADVERLDNFNQQLRQTWDTSWEEGWRYGTLGLLFLAAISWLLGRYLVEQMIALMCIRYFPDGRLRRSFMAIATVLITMLAAMIALDLIKTAFFRTQSVSPQIQDFTAGFIQLNIFCALIAGLGRAYLSLRRPSWRLTNMDDAIASGMRFLSPLLAVLAVFFGTVELINDVIGASLSSTVQGNWLATALMALILLAIPFRARRIRHNLERQGINLEKRSTISGIVQISIMVSAVIILFALLLGYVAFARFLTYQLLWVALVLMTFYFLIVFFADLCTAVFSPKTACGRALKVSLNIKDHHLEQLTIIFTAFFKCLLVLLTAIALFNGSFGTTTFSTLVNDIITILCGEGIKSLHIVPGKLFNAVLCLIVGIYIIRVSQRWLSHELLPKTISDIGIRASLITLFTNLGYVLLILITLAALGIQWNNLAWIVSALSVGIGFGLQEIVKNFISGMILLTERPVKVGDRIGIAGVEGDVRRINVRATEIQLSDRSTMIVPNSQLIAQNVRNVTMGNAEGVVSIALSFPIDIDPEEVRDILLSAFNEYEAILPTPAPYVRFSQLNPEGIILTVTGYVANPRIVSVSKSDLLFNILKQLRTQEVNLSSPRKIMIVKEDLNACDVE